MLAGICGANITVAQAYIADVTPAAERSKKMGLIGMAFGLGFIFGPALAGFSIKWFGHTGPGCSGQRAVRGEFYPGFGHIARRAGSPLPSTWRHGRISEQWAHTLSQPAVGFLIVVFFLATFCFACFETTLGLMVQQNFQLDTRRADDAKTIAILFAYCGIVGAFIQGGPIGRLVKKFGEQKTHCAEPVAGGGEPGSDSLHSGTHRAVLAGIAARGRATVAGLAGSAGFVVHRFGLTRPPLFGLLSMLTPAHEQGATIGVAQSAGSLARILGPILPAASFNFIRRCPTWHACRHFAGGGIAAWHTCAGRTCLWLQPKCRKPANHRRCNRSERECPR